MPSQLTIFARIKPKPEHREAARAAVLNIVEKTRAEPGCRAFTLHDNWENGKELYLYEVWDTEAALDEHHEQPYTRAVFDSYQNWLSQPVEIIRLRQIG